LQKVDAGMTLKKTTLNYEVYLTDFVFGTRCLTMTRLSKLLIGPDAFLYYFEFNGHAIKFTSGKISVNTRLLERN
jgi:hypothetical protein